MSPMGTSTTSDLPSAPIYLPILPNAGEIWHSLIDAGFLLDLFTVMNLDGSLSCPRARELSVRGSQIIGLLSTLFRVLELWFRPRGSLPAFITPLSELWAS